jgi:pimeloyl-ACP methyl ester carboxylesterase
LFTGEYDRFTPPEGMREFSKRCPNATIKLIPNSDHFFHVQNRKKTNECIIEFFGIEVGSEAVA